MTSLAAVFAPRDHHRPHRSSAQTLRIRRAVTRRLNPACWHIPASYDALACDVEHSYHGALGGIPRCDRLGSRKQLD
jgi:hypothetical protein